MATKKLNEMENNGWVVDLDEAKKRMKHAEEVKGRYTERNKDLQEYQNAYLGKWSDKAQITASRQGAKIVQSPDARNEVLGAVGLMIGTDPTFNIEPVSQAPAGFDKDALENSLDRWWEYSGRLKRRPIHYDIVLSAILYGEMHTSINPMQDIISRMEKTKVRDESKKKVDRRIERIKRAEAITPILLESWSPLNGYPETDQLGLTGFLREIKTSPDQIISNYMDILPNEYLGKSGSSTSSTLKIWYDLDWMIIEVDGKPIYMQEMPYTDIPIDFTLTGTGGSELFEKAEDQRQPLLYTIMKHGLYNAQNLMMTVLYTTVFSVGITALMKHTAPESDPEKQLVMNFDNIIGVAEMEPGEQLDVMNTAGMISPQFQEAFKLAEQKGYESTIYPQAFGAAIGRNTTFSEMSLLGQAGRLPLIGTQRMGGEGISHIVELALMAIRETKYKYKSNEIEFNPALIPENVIVNTKLDVKLPQDQLQLANVANMLKQAGLADNEWIQQNIMNMQDYKGMQKRIWKEQAQAAMFGVWLDQQIKQMQPPPEVTPPMPPEATSPVPTDMMPPEIGMEPGAAQAGIAPEGLPGAQAGMVAGAGMEASVPVDLQAGRTI